MQGNGLIFASILQGGAALLEASPKGSIKIVVPALLNFTEEIEGSLLQTGQLYWHPQPSVPLPARPDWIVNTCADADSFSDALQFLDASYQQELPIFNHPRAVIAARRDIAGVVLRDVAGLEVPRCQLFRGTSPQSFSACFERNGFQYPVTVHPATVANGFGRVRISHSGEWETAIRKGGGGRKYFMVQSMPDEANAPRCLRIVIVGRSFYVVELPQAQSGGAGALSPMPIVDFLSSTVKSIMMRMPLDYWTLDVSVTAADRLRMLDISAGLHVPAAEDEFPLLRKQVIELTRKVAPRLLAVLSKPAQWRHDAHRLPNIVEMKKEKLARDHKF